MVCLLFQLDRGVNHVGCTRHRRLSSCGGSYLGIPVCLKHAEAVTVFARRNQRPTSQGLLVVADHDNVHVAVHAALCVDFRNQKSVVVALAAKIYRLREGQTNSPGVM